MSERRIFMKKALIFMLVATLLLPCLLAGCNDTPPTETTPETTTEEILTETAEAITEELIITESIRENVIVSPETDGTETTTEKKHLVPWW
jgi:hypothetical protein